MKRIRFFPSLAEDGTVSFSGIPPSAPLSITLFNQVGQLYKIASLYIKQVSLPKYIAECRLQSVVPKNAMTIQDVRHAVTAKQHLVLNGKPVEVKFYVLAANDIKGVLTIACVIQDRPVSEDAKKAFNTFVKLVKDDFTFHYKTAFKKMLADHDMTMQKYYRLRRKGR